MDEKTKSLKKDNELEVARTKTTTIQSKTKSVPVAEGKTKAIAAAQAKTKSTPIVESKTKIIETAQAKTKSVPVTESKTKAIATTQAKTKTISASESKTKKIAIEKTAALQIEKNGAEKTKTVEQKVQEPEVVDLALLSESGKDLTHREDIGVPPAKKMITPEERAEKLERDIVHLRKTLKIKPWEHIPVIGTAIYELRVDTHLTEAEDNLIVGFAFEEGLKFMLKGLIVFSILALIISPLAWKYIIEKAIQRGVHSLENKHLIPPLKSFAKKEPKEAKKK